MPSTSYFSLAPPHHHFSTPKHMSSANVSHLHFCPLTPPALSEPSIAPPSSSSQHPAVHRSFSSPKATTLLSQVALRSRAASDHGSPTRALDRHADNNDDVSDEEPLKKASCSNSAARVRSSAADHTTDTSPTGDKNRYSSPSRTQQWNDSTHSPSRRKRQKLSPSPREKLAEAKESAVADARQYVSFPAFEHFYGDATQKSNAGIEV